MTHSNPEFLQGSLGRSGPKVFRLGLSATYRPGQDAIRLALDSGINCFFCFGFDTQATSALRSALPGRRDACVVITGAYNLVFGHADIRRSLERRLRQLRTDYIDVFLFLGVLHSREFPERAREEMRRLKEEGKVRAVGLSTHDRRFAGQLAVEGAVDTLMIRYNAAHRGAEQDIFPYLDRHRPGVISYTATRWRQLLRRPPGWPVNGPVPTAGQCYRFALSNPNVDVCLTAPTSPEQLAGTLAELSRGPLDDDEMRFMRDFGDAVYRARKWFL